MTLSDHDAKRKQPLAHVNQCRSLPLAPPSENDCLLYGIQMLQMQLETVGFYNKGPFIPTTPQHQEKRAIPPRNNEMFIETAHFTYDGCGRLRDKTEGSLTVRCFQ